MASNDTLANLAARMAGDWWAERLSDQHADKRQAFADAVALRVEQALSGQVHWSWRNSKEGDGVPLDNIYTECDYDPIGLLLEAVQEVIKPDCKGVFFSADGILPRKHGLRISRMVLRPKEGYGNHTDDIPVRQLPDGSAP